MRKGGGVSLGPDPKGVVPEIEPGVAIACDIQSNGSLGLDAKNSNTKGPGSAYHRVGGYGGGGGRQIAPMHYFLSGLRKIEYSRGGGARSIFSRVGGTALRHILGG